MVLGTIINTKNTKRIIGVSILATVLTSIFLTGSVAAGPADAVTDAIGDVLGEASTIGAVLLAGFGFYQLIMMGMKDQKSGPLKKAAVAWVLAIAVASWDDIIGFFTPDGTDVSASTIQGSDPATATTITSEITNIIQTVSTAELSIALTVGGIILIAVFLKLNNFTKIPKFTIQ